MKLFNVGLLASSFMLPHFVLGAVRRDLAQKNIPVAEMEGKYNIDHNDQEILFTDPDSDFEEVFRCTHRSGKKLTFNENRTFVACCAPGQHLVGSAATAFDCCGAGHDLAGSHDVGGYSCCPTGQTYDGKRCREPDPVCKNGKTLVDGHCVCPSGYYADHEGFCRRREEPPRQECDSGLREGKCYIFKMENDLLLGYDNNGYYTAAEDSAAHIFGKFKFCKTEDCNGNTAVDPGQNFRIRDLHGAANSGGRANEWLNNVVNGGHIGKTPLWAEAGEFSITRWTCGKYCLSGFRHGLGPTCPSVAPALTFNTVDPQACRPLVVIEVPCDVRAAQNNCAWSKTAGGCGPGDDAHCKCH